MLTESRGRAQMPKSRQGATNRWSAFRHLTLCLPLWVFTTVRAERYLLTASRTACGTSEFWRVFPCTLFGFLWFGRKLGAASARNATVAFEQHF